MQDGQGSTGCERVPLTFSFVVPLAHTRGEAELLSDGQQPVVPAMVAAAVCITLNDDGARVVEQHVLGHTAEVDEGLPPA